ncbi:hypothetical protein [Peribacillus huizhouensis]|uniref:Uncharacterized protein n=1 Tax=Peribacillus huizhouensis TaxID=1501239 RepID=A0ABR6CTB1_9BACI|nr:hypothetical protein [Peribacillus huizhouensis]MBA9027582.1 hypothetical protein [Peribacillus huizhouensis]
MTKFKKRIYLDKQPEVGDRIVAIDSSGFSGNHYKYGNEMTIISTETMLGGGVFAMNHRTGKKVCISDCFYRIFRDVTYEKTGEKHVTKKLLGIPIYSKIIDIYAEVGV